MMESSTYRAIWEQGWREGFKEGFREGTIAEARKLLRLLGDDAFGPPDRRTAAVIAKLDDLEQLEALFLRILKATSWRELLSQPPQRGGGRTSWKVGRRPRTTTALETGTAIACNRRRPPA